MLLSLKPILQSRQNMSQSRYVTETPMTEVITSSTLRFDETLFFYSTLEPAQDLMSGLKQLNNSFDEGSPTSKVSNYTDGSGQQSSLIYPTLDFALTESPMDIDPSDLIPPAFTPVEIIWIVLFSIMLSLAVFGNFVVIWIISCHRRMRTVTNYFLLNLSVADLTMATLNGAPNFFYMLRNDWIFGKFFCIINNFVANWTVASCVFTMTAISIDRWMAIIKPLKPRMTKKTAWFWILGIWVGSAILACPALFFSSIIPDTHSWRTYCIVVWPDGKSPTDSKFELGYNVCLMVLTYLIPMSAMAMCYGSMSWELWGQTQIGEVTQRQINSMISKRKVVRMFIVVVTTFAICWLPYHGYFIYMYMDKTIVHIKWIQHLYLSFYFLAMSQSSINPIIVVGMNSRFRNYICDLIFNCCSACKKEQTPRPVQYVAATPPLFRRFSQSCSRSRSGTGEDNHNQIPGFHHHPNCRGHTNRKLNPYTGNTHEVITLADLELGNCNVHIHNELTRYNKNGNTMTGGMSIGATYC